MACAAAATCMPALEKCLAAVEPMIAKATVKTWGGSYIDMSAMNAMLKEFYSPEKLEHLTYSESLLLNMVPS